MVFVHNAFGIQQSGCYTRLWCQEIVIAHKNLDHSSYDRATLQHLDHVPSCFALFFIYPLLSLSYWWYYTC